MAMTATATKSTRNFIIKSLCMQAPQIVYVPPNKDNILYCVMKKPRVGLSKVFKPIVEKLKAERSEMSRIIIFCKTYTFNISIFQVGIG